MTSLRKLYMLLVYLFLYCPIIVLIALSFNKAQYASTWHGFTWHWYKVLANDPVLIQVTRHSLLLSTLASTLATLIGTVAAVALFRFKFYGKRTLQGLIFILIMLPDIIMGTSLLLLYNLLHITLGFNTLLLAHITLCMPFALVTIYGRINDMDKNLFEAAKDLGAGDFAIFTKILIPLLLPAIVAAWLLSFTLSLDDVIISFFVSGPNFQILPLEIYSMIRAGITPEINALCSVIFVLTLLIALTASTMLAKKPKALK